MKKIKQFFGWLFLNKPRPPEVPPVLAETAETLKKKGIDLAKKELKKKLINKLAAKKPPAHGA